MERRIIETVRDEQTTWTVDDRSVTRLPDDTFLYERGGCTEQFSDRAALRDELEARDDIELYRAIFDDEYCKA